MFAFGRRDAVAALRIAQFRCPTPETSWTGPSRCFAAVAADALAEALVADSKRETARAYSSQ